MRKSWYFTLTLHHSDHPITLPRLQTLQKNADVKICFIFRFIHLTLECEAVSWWTELLEYALKHTTIQSIHLHDLKHRTLCHLWRNFYTMQFFLFYYEHTICGNLLCLNSTGSRVCLYCLRSNLKQWGISQDGGLSPSQRAWFNTENIQFPWLNRTLVTHTLSLTGRAVSNTAMLVTLSHSRTSPCRGSANDRMCVCLWASDLLFPVTLFLILMKLFLGTMLSNTAILNERPGKGNVLQNTLETQTNKSFQKICTS